MNDLLTVGQCEADQLQSLIDLSLALEEKPKPVLQGKNILFVFEKPSLRTRVGTEAAINHLGGNVIQADPLVVLETEQDPYESRESIKDTMRNISQWCDAIFARVYAHETLEQMADYAEIPVVNALCDKHHPMQALADMLTLQERFGREEKVALTFVGDANNVAFSLIEIALKFGHDVRFTGPEKYYWSQDQLQYFGLLAVDHGSSFTHTFEPAEAVKNSDVIYTDTFVSMGEEHMMEEKLNHFKPYQVNGKLMEQANNGAGFMHCLPAHRGIEVTDEVIDHSNSWVHQQARNRMVVSKGVFGWLCT